MRVSATAMATIVDRQTARFGALNLATSCFRLLHLEPLSFPDRQVRCHLTDHVFTDNDDDDNTIPEYEAVSYAWGSDARTYSIAVNGADFAVTHNLFAILSHLAPSLPSQADIAKRTLWVDAVCIDQYNPHEQSHQVRLMKDIYSNARRVVFHLGHPTADTNLVMSALAMLHDRIDNFGRHYVDSLLLGIIWDEVQAELHSDFSAVHERQRNGLHDLLQRPWFRRVWIIHEAGNARDGLIQCGDRAVSCHTFVLAPGLLGVDVEAQRQDILDAMPTPRRAGSWLSPDKQAERSLFRLLQKFCRAEATLDRDRIYALLGLCDVPAAQGDNHHEMVVDYKKTDIDIVRDTIAHICSCKASTVPESFHHDIPSFLANLYSLDSRVFSLLVQSRDFESLVSMMQERVEHISIKQSHFYDAVRNPFCGGSITELLLASAQPGTIEVTEEIVVAAAQNQTQGLQVMAVLLASCASQIKLTEKVCRAVLMNGVQGPQIAQLLKQRVGNEVQLTHNIIIESVSSTHTWKAILSHLSEHGIDPQTLADVVTAAARKELKGEVILQSLLEDARFNVVVDEQLLLAITENKTNATKLLETVLRHRALGPFSETVLSRCMQHPAHAHALLDLLEQYQGIAPISETLAQSRTPELWSFIKEGYHVRNFTHKTNGDKARTDEGQPVLWWAILRSDIALTELLLDLGASLDIEHPVEGPPILRAVASKNTGMVEVLLSRGAKADLSIVHHSFFDPLLIASMNDDATMLALLLDRGELGVDRVVGELERTTLQMAAEAGKINAVRFLVSRGADIYQADMVGRTALHCAAGKGQLETVRLLVEECGADVDAGVGRSWYTVLSIAVKERRVAVAEFLLQSGADVNGCGWKAMTPLHLAVQWQWPEMVRLLLDHGAGCQMQDRDRDTPRDYAMKLKEREVLDMIDAHLGRVQ
ncbi:ankyrin repeat domain-containing protein 50 [Microdochium nivale]|nr:ankyrin repeat domain-containing protein 50 [Microdochium nivale]